MQNANEKILHEYIYQVDLTVIRYKLGRLGTEIEQNNKNNTSLHFIN